MKSLCKHDEYRIIDWVREPKYSTDEILIDVHKIGMAKNLLIKFTQCNKYPDWFYMDGDMVRRCPTQPNGRSEVFVVPMDEREEFVPNNKCEHA